MAVTGSHQTLRAMLYTLSAIAAVAALVLIFVPSWPLSFAPGSVPPPSNPFEFGILRAFGIVVLVIAYLLCVAARDPDRNAALVNAFIFLLVAVAVLNLYLAASQELVAYYPSVYLVVRAVIQVMLAIVLFVLRPKRITGSV